MKKLFRRLFKKHHILPLAMLALFLCILLALCIAMDSLELTFGLRQDLSFNALTSLSATTEEILAEVDKPVHIYALYSTGTGDPALYEVLNRYQVMCDQITWEQADITLNPGLVSRFRGDADNAVSTDSLIVYCEQTDRYKIISATDLVAVSYDVALEGYTVSGLNYEKKLTEAIIYVTREIIPKIAIMQGHGELDPDLLGFFTAYLESNNYAVSFVNLFTGDTLPEDALLMILSPQRDLQPSELTLLTSFVSGGGALFITCDPADNIANMPNYQSLLRSYGFLPLDGVVIAAKDEAGTYYDKYPYILIPTMQQTALTSALKAGSEDTLLLIQARAFESPEQGDKNLQTETVLYSGYKSYLSPLYQDGYAYTQKATDRTGPFSLGILASRLTDSAQLSRALIVGNSAFLTDSGQYAISDNGAFILKAVQYLLNQEPIALAIAQKPAVPPGLNASSQTFGIFLIIAAPLSVLLAALIVLVPRRHR